MEDRRKLHNEELYNLYSSPRIIRMVKLRSIKWAAHIMRKGFWCGNPEGQRRLGRPGLKWEDNIK
jgi:hypothetical protein